ncbi:hypothetical protein P7K49_026585, partial [Saguinus oedipus]
MTSRGPGRASGTQEMEEKEILRRQIRLLQGRFYRDRDGSPLLSPSPRGGSPAPPRRRGRSPPAGSECRLEWGTVGSVRTCGPARGAGQSPAPALSREWCWPCSGCGRWRRGRRLVTRGRRRPTHPPELLGSPVPTLSPRALLRGWDWFLAHCCRAGSGRTQ